MTKTKLAERMRVHSSLLTNVSKGRAELTTDQLFLFAAALELTDVELQFLELLWNMDRTALASKKQLLEQQMNALKNKYISVSHVTDLGDGSLSQDALAFYWTTPLAQIIVLSLSVKKYARHPKKLIDELSVNEEYFDSIFDKLTFYGLLKKEKYTWVAHMSNYHLPKESPLSSPQNQMMRMASLQHLLKLKEEKRYNLSVTFCADKEAYYAIQSHIVNAIRKSQETVGKSQKHEQVFQLNIDLFPWTS